MNKITRPHLLILLGSVLVVSPLCADVKNAKTYVVDLYNAKKNDGWSCYFWKSDAEDQAVKAGKACGENEASLYWQAAEYAEELRDEATAISLKRTYANDQYTMGPTGLTAGFLFMAGCAKYFYDKVEEPHKLRRENSSLNDEINDLEEQLRRKKNKNNGGGFGGFNDFDDDFFGGDFQSNFKKNYKKYQDSSNAKGSYGYDSGYGSSNGSGTGGFWQQVPGKRQKALAEFNGFLKGQNLGQLTADSPKDEIERAFRKLSLQLHPDRFPDLEDAAKAKVVADYQRMANARDDLVAG